MATGPARAILGLMLDSSSHVLDRARVRDCMHHGIFGCDPDVPLADGGDDHGGARRSRRRCLRAWNLHGIGSDGTSSAPSAVQALSRLSAKDVAAAEATARFVRQQQLPYERIGTLAERAPGVPRGRLHLASWNAPSATSFQEPRLWLIGSSTAASHSAKKWQSTEPWRANCARSPTSRRCIGRSRCRRWMPSRRCSWVCPRSPALTRFRRVPA